MSEVPDFLFRLIVDRTAVPFVLIDREGGVHFASESITEMTGWQASELVGRNMLEFIDETQVDAALEGIGEVDGSAQTDAGIPIVFAIRNAWGGWSWVEVAAMPFFDHPELGLIALRLRSLDHQQLRLALGRRPQYQRDRRVAHRRLRLDGLPALSGESEREPSDIGMSEDGVE